MAINILFRSILGTKHFFFCELSDHHPGDVRLFLSDDGNVPKNNESWFYLKYSRYFKNNSRAVSESEVPGTKVVYEELSKFFDRKPKSNSDSSSPSEFPNEPTQEDKKK